MATRKNPSGAHARARTALDREFKDVTPCASRSNEKRRPDRHCTTPMYIPTLHVWYPDTADYSELVSQRHGLRIHSHIRPWSEKTVRLICSSSHLAQLSSRERNIIIVILPGVFSRRSPRDCLWMAFEKRAEPGFFGPSGWSADRESRIDYEWAVGG